MFKCYPVKLSCYKVMKLTLCMILGDSEKYTLMVKVRI